MSGQLTPHCLMPVQPTAMELYRRTSPEGEMRIAKRARASRPKVKSGCITCKTRRVKCDETKPQCRRCQKFGRVCDGYPEPMSGRGVTMIPIQPRIPSVSMYAPSVSIHTTEEESQYFQTFVEKSAQELPGFYESNFWTRLVLQESQTVPAIRHAVIAIGALNKSLENAPGPDLKVNVIQSIDKKHHEYAVLQYLKAIQALNYYISASESPQLRTTLVACLLFICFETFQGSYASSIQQTYGGLKILRSYYVGKPGSKPWIPRRQLPESYAKINKVLQKRLGFDSASKATAVSMHLEEYLETEENLQSDSESKVASISDIFVYDSGSEQVVRNETPGTNFAKEQQKNVMALPSRDRSTYSPPRSSLRSSDVRKTSTTSNSTTSSTDACITSSFRKPSSAFSNSAVSTPLTYTPPSTGPHTPSPSYAPPSQAHSTSRKRPLASRSPTPPALHNDFAIEDILIQTFARLDGQGLFFGMVPGIPPLIWDIHESWHLPIPDSFPDFASAQRCWDFLMDRALQFFRGTGFKRAYAPANSDSPEKIAHDHSFYIQQISAFASAFKPLLDNAMSPDGTTILDPPVLLLNLYQKLTIIILASAPSDSEMVYDAFLQDFKYIIRICTMLISSQDHTQAPRNTRFSFETGVVPPLHFTATKCRDPVVRRKAVDLLWSSPRQEGMWDGVLSARIGTWITNCEEDGLEPPLQGSRHASLSEASSFGGIEMGGVSSYPSPPQFTGDAASEGCWDGDIRISDTVNDLVASTALNAYDGRISANNVVPTRPASTTKNRKSSVAEGKMAQGKGWMVPEENRVRIMVVNFQIPDRYIKVKCQKVLPGVDRLREERETVIAW